MVIEDRLDALLPLAALVRERVPQPHPRAQIEEMVRRDPRLGQPSDHQQLATWRASARSLLARFLFPRRAAVSAGSARCTTAPTRRNSSATKRQPVVASSADLELLTTEPLRELAHASPVRRRDPRSRDLTGVGVDPLCGDLRSVLIQTITIVIWGLLKLHGLQACAATAAPELRRSLHASPDGLARSCHLSSHAGHPRPATSDTAKASQAHRPTA